MFNYKKRRLSVKKQISKKLSRDQVSQLRPDPIVSLTFLIDTGVKSGNITCKDRILVG